MMANAQLKNVHNLSGLNVKSGHLKKMADGDSSGKTRAIDKDV